MSATASQITVVPIVYSTVCSSPDQSKLHVTGFCEGNSLVVGEFPENDSGAKMFPFDDVIIKLIL